MASDKQLFPPEIDSAMDGCKNLISVWQKYFQADTWPCEIIVYEMHPMCCTLNLTPVIFHTLCKSHDGFDTML